MKYLLLGSIVFISFSATLAEANDKLVNVKFGANSGGFGFGPAIEVKVAQKITLGLLYETISLSSDGVSASSTGYGINARYYFDEALSQGTYLHASIVTGDAEASSGNSSVEVDVSSANLTFGHTWMWEHFNLDSSFGLRSMSLDEYEANGGVDTSSLDELDGIGLAVSFTIGYAF